MTISHDTAILLLNALLLAGFLLWLWVIHKFVR